MRDDDAPDDNANVDDTWHEDKDAAPTLEGRVAQMQAELRKLLMASAAATALVGGLIVIVDVWRATGFVNIAGFLVGAAVATLNLWLLAGGYFQVLRGSGMSARALLAFLGSFLGLVLLAGWIVFSHRAWTLGFALGLTTPAIAGILYGRTLR